MKHVKILAKPKIFEGPALAQGDPFPTIGEKVGDLLCKMATGAKCP